MSRHLIGLSVLCIGLWLVNAAQANQFAQTPPVQGIVQIPVLYAPASGESNNASVPLYEQADRRSKILLNATSQAALDWAEYAPKQKGALVYGAREGWYRLRLAHFSEPTFGWLPAEHVTGYHSFTALLLDNPSHTTKYWDRQIHGAPAGEAVALPMEPDRRVFDLDILQTQRLGGRLWLSVRVLAKSHCEQLGEGQEPEVLAEGWIPAHTAQGEPMAWFYVDACQ